MLRQFEFPYTARSAFLLYRLLQLRFASREQIIRHIFKGAKKTSLPVLASKHLKAFLDNGYIKEQFGLFYVTQKGYEALHYILENQPLRKNSFTDKLTQRGD